jgi:hypothetical protein
LIDSAASKECQCAFSDPLVQVGEVAALKKCRGSISVSFNQSYLPTRNIPCPGTQREMEDHQHETQYSFCASVAFLLITTSKLKVSGALGKQSIFVSIYVCFCERSMPVPWLRLHVRLRLLATDKLMGRSVFRILLGAVDRQALQRRRIVIGPAYAGTDTLPTDN